MRRPRLAVGLVRRHTWARPAAGNWPYAGDSGTDVSLGAVRLIWLIHVATFFFFFALGLSIPILPIYLAEEFGITAAWIGWAVALMPLAGILLRPWSGSVTDSLSRKWPTVLGLAVSGVAGILYFGTLWLVLLARVLQGAGLAFFAPASLALTSDLASEDRLTGIMSTRNLLVGVGIMSGSAVAGVVAEWLGFRAVFALMAAVQLVFVPLLSRLPETLQERRRASWWRSYLDVLKVTAITAATIGNLGFAAVLATLQAYYPLILSEAGFTTALIGAFFGFYSFVSVLFRIPAGPLAQRFTAERVALWGFALTFLGLAVLWWQPLPPWAFVAGTLMGAGSGLYLPANLVAVSHAAPRAIRGSAYSLYTMSWDVGGFAGPVVGGAVVGAVASAYGVLPLALMLATLVIFAYVRLLGPGVLKLSRAPVRSRADT